MNFYSYLMAKNSIEDTSYVNIDVVKNVITDLHLMMFENYIYKENNNFYIYSDDGYNIIESYIDKYFDNDEVERILYYYKYFKDKYLYFVFNFSEIGTNNIIFYSTWCDLLDRNFNYFKGFDIYEIIK